MPAPRYLADLAGTQRSDFRIKPDAATGPPTSGSHLLGEIHTDSAGRLWHCIASGTPGTWEPLAVVVGGEVPSLSVATHVLDSLDTAVFNSVRWAIELRKGTNVLLQEIVASHDGSGAWGEMRPTSMQVGTGTFDITIEVDVHVSGFMRLMVTPVTTGWTATWKRLYTLGTAI
jgi:hypothetical protein